MAVATARALRGGWFGGAFDPPHLGVLQAMVRDAIICIAQRAHATGASGVIDATIGTSNLPGARVEFLSMPAMDTSATDIRTRVAAHLGIDHLVPAAVARYIDQHHLYRTD